MTIQELAALAAKSINTTPRQIDAKITLVMPGQWRRSNYKRLVPKGKSPIGQIVEETANGLTVIFSAVDVLAWCAANGVEVQARLVKGD